MRLAPYDICNPGGSIEILSSGVAQEKNLTGTLARQRHIYDWDNGRI